MPTCLGSLDLSAAATDAICPVPVGILQSVRKLRFSEICSAACSIWRGAADPAPVRTCIPLSQLIPDGSALSHCQVGGLDLGFSIQHVRDLVLSPAALCSFHDFLDACDPKSRAWFLGPRQLVTRGDPGSVVLFADGSFSPPTLQRSAGMGWAVAAFCGGLPVGPMSCAGVMSGQVPADFLTTGQQPNAFIAECAALTFAGVLAATNFPACPTIFVSDCQAALSCAAGECAVSGDTVQSFVRNVHFFRASSSPPGPLRYAHVHSHEGDYGNELVDTAAKLAVVGSTHGRHSWERLSAWVPHGGNGLAWAGLVCRSLRGDATLPRFDGSPLGHDDDLGGMQAKEVIAPFLPKTPGKTGGHAASGRISLRIATANVLTLNSSDRDVPPQDRPSGLARQVAKPALLAQSLLDAGVNVACIQESRCEKGTIRTMGYLCFCSGPLTGQYGTEIWFSSWA